MNPCTNIDIERLRKSFKNYTSLLTMPWFCNRTRLQ
jgi:hypothetical protein